MRGQEGSQPLSLTPTSLRWPSNWSVFNLPCQIAWGERRLKIPLPHVTGEEARVRVGVVGGGGDDCLGSPWAVAQPQWGLRPVDSWLCKSVEKSGLSDT